MFTLPHFWPILPTYSPLKMKTLARNGLTLSVPTPQNSQAHSNCLSVFDHFVGLALRVLRDWQTAHMKLPKNG